jgi:hypothetical protein
MAQLRLPITKDGPILSVAIGITGAQMAALQASGKPIPAPLVLRGVADTGTDITAVKVSQLQQLGITPTASSTTQTASGQFRVDLFDISLMVPGATASAGPIVVRPLLTITELAESVPDVDLLLGRDILDECLFIYDGPGGQFLLAS